MEQVEDEGKGCIFCSGRSEIILTIAGKSLLEVKPVTRSLTKVSASRGGEHIVARPGRNVFTTAIRRDLANNFVTDIKISDRSHNCYKLVQHNTKQFFENLENKFVTEIT